MRAAFIHDHNFVYNEEDGNYYDGSGGAFDVGLWHRYLAVFEGIVVVGREMMTLPNKLVLSSTDKVKFKLISGAHGAKSLLRNKARIKVELEAIVTSVDFVIIRLPSTLGSWAARICKKNKVKYVIEVVGDPLTAYWNHGGVLGKLVAPIQAMIMKRIVKDAPFVIYVTQETLQRKYPCQNQVESISNVRLLDTINERQLISFYLQERPKFILGVIGTFHVKYKGHKELIKALRLLRDKGYFDIEVQLVGTGDSEWVLDLAKGFGVDEQLKIIGTVEAGINGVFPFLDQLDVYVHPSLTEGLPRVVIEALSRGRICLTSDAGGTGELVSTSFVHRAGDWRKLAEDIEKVYKMDKKDRLLIARKNLSVAHRYLETTLQARRVLFLERASS